MNLDYLGDEASWARLHFGQVELGDERRTDRLVSLAHACALQPGSHLPSLFARPYDIKAAYALLRHDSMLPDTIQSVHRDLVWRALHLDGLALLVEDTSELSWLGRGDIDGFGPVGSSKSAKIGFHLHSVLALRWHGLETVARPGRRPAVDLLGLADQQFHVRVPQPKDRPRQTRRGGERDRESAVWEAATRRIGPAPQRDAVRWVRVCDAAADIYEHVQDCQAAGHGHVIRSCQDRKLIEVDGEPGPVRLLDRVRAAPSLGRFELYVHARAGEPAHTVEIEVSAVEVVIRAPQRAGVGPGTLEPMRCSAVRAWESGAEANQKRIEWVLLCDGKVKGYEAARERVRQYATRWVIEEYHKALKTGLKVEEAQLRTGARLKALVAVASVVAVRVLALGEEAKTDPEAEVERMGMEEEEMAVLRAYTGKAIRTVGEAVLAIGRMGGHMNRRADGMPGWQTLWRGMARLAEMVEGYRLARKLMESG
jgi:hypothetical protein